MSKSDYDAFTKTGRIPGTTETFVSPTQAFSKSYDGVLVEFQMAPGTLDSLKAIGVRSHGQRAAELLPDLPVVKSGWGRKSALFKVEGSQVNIGLGTGRALETFNESIRGFVARGVNR